MRFALCALLLPALAARGEDAEKLYRQMEQKITKAKAFHVVADVDAKGKDGKAAKIHIDATLAEGNKVRLKVKGTADAKDVGMEMVSDGKNLRTVMAAAGKGPPDQETPDRFTEVVAAVMARVGLIGGFRATAQKGKDRKIPDVEKLFGLHDLKMGKPETVNGREAKVIRYTIKVSEPKEETVNVTLWLDAKTLLPMKRLLEIPAEMTRVTETYTEFNLHPKIDAKTFELGS